MSLPYEAFIRAYTRVQDVPFLAGMRLYLADEIIPVWKALQALEGKDDLPPPFWAFAWAGGLGQARFVLDNPEWVRGQRVLDFASGSGLGAIAALRAGAASVTAADIDPVAMTALRLNAALNDVTIEASGPLDLSQPLTGYDLIMAGDVCYERGTSQSIVQWLRLCAGAGQKVVLADPKRSYAPERLPDPPQMVELAQMTVPTLLELEDSNARDVTIWQLTG